MNFYIILLLLYALPSHAMETKSERNIYSSMNTSVFDIIYDNSLNAKKSSELFEEHSATDKKEWVIDAIERYNSSKKPAEHMNNEDLEQMSRLLTGTIDGKAFSEEQLIKLVYFGDFINTDPDSSKKLILPLCHKSPQSINEDSVLAHFFNHQADFNRLVSVLLSHNSPMYGSGEQKLRDMLELPNTTILDVFSQFVLLDQETKIAILKDFFGNITISRYTDKKYELDRASIHFRFNDISTLQDIFNIFDIDTEYLKGLSSWDEDSLENFDIDELMNTFPHLVSISMQKFNTLSAKKKYYYVMQVHIRGYSFSNHDLEFLRSVFPNATLIDHKENNFYHPTTNT